MSSLKTIQNQSLIQKIGVHNKLWWVGPLWSQKGLAGSGCKTFDQKLSQWIPHREPQSWSDAVHDVAGQISLVHTSTRFYEYHRLIMQTSSPAYYKPPHTHLSQWVQQDPNIVAKLSYHQPMAILQSRSKRELTICCVSIWMHNLYAFSHIFETGAKRLRKERAFDLRWSPTK